MPPFVFPCVFVFPRKAHPAHHTHSFAAPRFFANYSHGTPSLLCCQTSQPTGQPNHPDKAQLAEVRRQLQSASRAAQGTPGSSSSAGGEEGGKRGQGGTTAPSPPSSSPSRSYCPRDVQVLLCCLRGVHRVRGRGIGQPRERAYLLGLGLRALVAGCRAVCHVIISC